MAGVQGALGGNPGVSGDTEVDDAEASAEVDLDALKEVSTLRELQKEAKKSASDIRDLIKRKSQSNMPAVRPLETKEVKP